MAVAFKITLCDHCEGQTLVVMENECCDVVVWEFWLSNVASFQTFCFSHMASFCESKRFSVMLDFEAAARNPAREAECGRSRSHRMGMKHNRRAHGTTRAWITTHFVPSLNAAKNITMAFKCLMLRPEVNRN